MVNFIGAWRVAFGLMKHSQGGIVERATRCVKYTRLYNYHLEQRQDLIRRNLQIRKKRNEDLIKKDTTYYTKILSKYLRKRQQLLAQGRQQLGKLEDQNVRESLMKDLIKSSFEKLNLFYESLQSLVEGRRQVLHNEEFVFDDGLSVKDKREKFQLFLSKFLGKIDKKSTPNHGQPQ